jgi:hypothetical protein
MYKNADCEKTQAPMDPREFELIQDVQRKERAYAECVAKDAYAGQCGRAMSSEEVVAEFFKYHAPNETTIPKYAAINQAAKNFAEVILANCPSGADRTGAINCIRMARMTANAAIALNGLSLY